MPAAVAVVAVVGANSAGVFVGMSLAATIVAGVAIGAVAGGAFAAVTGGDVLEGALMGGLAGGFAGAGAVAAGGTEAAAAGGVSDMGAVGAEIAAQGTTGAVSNSTVAANLALEGADPAGLAFTGDLAMNEGVTAVGEIEAGTGLVSNPDTLSTGTGLLEKAASAAVEEGGKKGFLGAAADMLGLKEPGNAGLLIGSTIMGGAEMYGEKIKAENAEEIADTAYQRSKKKLGRGVNVGNPRISYGEASEASSQNPANNQATAQTAVYNPLAPKPKARYVPKEDGLLNKPGS